MQCDECSCWTVSEFTYDELYKAWHQQVGRGITPDYKKRYEKEVKRRIDTCYPDQQFTENALIAAKSLQAQALLPAIPLVLPTGVMGSWMLQCSRSFHK